VFLLVAVAVSGQSLVGYSAQTYLMMALLAFVPQLIGHSAANFALRFVPPHWSPWRYWGNRWGDAARLFHSQRSADVNEIAGGVLVLSGIFAVLRRGLLSSALLLVKKLAYPPFLRNNSGTVSFELLQGLW